jgi:hypothetical protein
LPFFYWLIVVLVVCVCLVVAPCWCCLPCCLIVALLLSARIHIKNLAFLLMVDCGVGVVSALLLIVVDALIDAHHVD